MGTNTEIPADVDLMRPDNKAFLDYDARCRQAFRPFAPIDLPDFFKGRHEHIELLSSELAKPGRHVAIYGERGVGKTSLAVLADFFANFSDDDTAFIRCERTSTYEMIFTQALEKAGVSYLPNGTETQKGSTMGLGVGSASVSRSKTKVARLRAVESARTIAPATLIKVFGKRKGLIILDEYDRVEDRATDTRLAETLKHFSDAASETKIIVVGVAETLAELIGEHESITRCVAQIKLERMAPEELSEIVETGEYRTGAVFKDSIKRRIVDLADGFPFYTHLLCSYCAEEAGKVLLDDPRANVVVSEDEYRKALRKAIETAEGTLRDYYQAAVITVRRKTDMYRDVLWGIANSRSNEVQIREIAENIGLLTGTRPTPESLSNPLGVLIKHERREILTRVRQGYYKFANPLMRAYIRFVLEDRNIVEMNGQMQFPWMREK